LKKGRSKNQVTRRLKVPTKQLRLRLQKLEGKPFVCERDGQQFYDKFEAEAPPGCYEQIIKRTKKYKTNQQVKMHFGLLIDTIIARANDEGIDTSKFLKLLLREDLPTGVGLTKDFLHQLFYLVCPTYDAEGRRVTLSKMSTTEASDWFDRCRNLLSSRGLYVDDPDPDWRNKKSKLRR